MAKLCKCCLWPTLTSGRAGWGRRNHLTWKAALTAPQRRPLLSAEHSTRTSVVIETLEMTVSRGTSRLSVHGGCKRGPTGAPCRLQSSS